MPQFKKIWPLTFKLAFCERFDRVPDEYEAQVFWRCLYRHAIPVAAVFYWLKPDFFKEDFDLIRDIGEVNDPQLFRSELNFFYGRNVRDKNWVRRIFNIRVSADRLLALKNRVYHNPLLAAALLR